MHALEVTGIVPPQLGGCKLTAWNLLCLLVQCNVEHFYCHMMVLSLHHDAAKGKGQLHVLFSQPVSKGYSCHMHRWFGIAHIIASALCDLTTECTHQSACQVDNDTTVIQLPAKSQYELKIETTR